MVERGDLEASKSSAQPECGVSQVIRPMVATGDVGRLHVRAPCPWEVAAA